MAAGTGQQTQVYAEGPDVRPRLAAHPEDAEIPLRVVFDQFALVNGADAELTLDRRDQGRALEERPSQRLDGAVEALCVVEGRMQADDADILLPRRLLRLDEARRAIDADDEAAGDLRVECTGVAGLFDAQYAFDPANYLMA